MSKHLAEYFAQIEGEEGYTPVNIVAFDGHMYKVNVDGKEYEVDYSVSGNNLHSFLIDNVSYSVDMSSSAPNTFDIFRADDFFKVEVLDEMKKFMKERVAQGLQGRQVIDTQMPGLIMKVLVEPGQEVELGQPLMILVAMKMENEIKAPKAGVVQDIFVKESQTVAAGDKLIIIE
jgi:biotin carboxyl carrier protein